MRYIYQNHFTDQAGNIVSSGTITVYNANSTVLAIIYSSSGSTGSVSGSAITSGTDGFFSFWVDTSDYSYASGSRFKMTLAKTNFQAKTYDDAMIIPAIDAATATTSGIVEFATDAETLTGTATDRALTPANLVARNATSTRAGIIEIATNAETITGASATLAVTPASLLATIQDYSLDQFEDEHNTDGTHKQSSFSVHKNATNQTGIISGDWTKLTWSTEEWDTNSNFASSTFTPTIADDYEFIAAATLLLPVDQTALSVAIYKNGSLAKQSQNYASGTVDVSALVTAVINANGTTDYFDVYVKHTSGSNKDIYGVASFTFFQGFKIN